VLHAGRVPAANAQESDHLNYTPTGAKSLILPGLRERGILKVPLHQVSWRNRARFRGVPRGLQVLFTARKRDELPWSIDRRSAIRSSLS
jgi:hypothetical protein